MLGAYLLLFPHARVLLIAPVVGATYVPAGIVLGLWFVMQLLNGGASLGSQGRRVAFFAHIGGFIAGMVLIGFFKRPEVRFFKPGRTESFSILSVAIPRLDIQQFTDFPRQIVLPVGLLQEVFSIHSMTGNRLVGKSGHEQRLHFGCCRTNRLANSRPLISGIERWLTVR